ncbi:MAG: hypothetical protein WCO09_01280 [bacterium]
MKWSTQKQLVYGFSFILILIIIIGVPVYFNFFDKAPTCFDGKQNQDETGVDCGGVCSVACSRDVIEDPLILWSRAFPIANGKYNLVAYLQNPNISYISEPFTYVFSVFDQENVLIGTREGTISAPYDKNFVVFEQAFDAGKRVVGKITFEINSKIVWTKSSEEKPKFDISSDQIVTVGGTPTLTSTITNKTVDFFRNFYVVAIVYGVNGNAMVVSRTLVDELRPNGKAMVVFTWPYLTDLRYSKIELLPRI